jgi:DNA phosphorothioation system restriction enzyme
MLTLTAMGLEQRRYRGSRAKLLREFYLPCLGAAVDYRRAVGFFTSEVLSAATSGISAFIQSDGSMRLVASPRLEAEDVRAINDGYRLRDQVVEERLVESLNPRSFPDPVRERLALLAWLIAYGRLEIKIALVKTSGGYGLYHEKFGAFTDGEGHTVAFGGSANETIGGLVSNYESIDVFRSWILEDVDRVQEKVEDFEALWSDETEDLVVFDFPDAAKQRLLELKPPSRPTTEPAWDDNTENEVPSGSSEGRGWGEPSLPKGITLREYQKLAVKRWLEAEGKGILRMATGTGKTITALGLVSILFESLQRQGRGMVCVIVCPFKHLVTQWAEVAKPFGVFPLKCFESGATWQPYLRQGVDAVNGGYAPFLMAVVTNRTLQSPAFVETVARANQGTLLIVGDEVHNLGTETYMEALPGQARYRLGLSATPERWFDPTGTESLLGYFGPVVYELGLAEAIEIDALCHYTYQPHFVCLSDEEHAKYIALSRRIATLLASDPDRDIEGGPSSGPLEALLFARARLVASAENKLDVLRTIMEPLRGSTHNLIYCGDGRVESESSEETQRQIEAVVHLLGIDLGMATNSYTADTYLDDRAALRRRFAAGDLQNLVAIRCLDEGMDIPETRRAVILASSSNPKQWIQRRGRVLRRSKGKKLAEIHDLLVVPQPSELSDQEYNIERRLVRRELERVIEFAGLANNRIEAMAVVTPVQEVYGLLDMG